MNFRLETFSTNPGGFPTFNTGNTLLVLPGYTDVTYDNGSSGLPFNPAVVTPMIPNWYRVPNSSSSPIFTTNVAAQAVFSSTQDWNFFKWSFPGLPFSGTSYNMTSFSYFVPATGTTVTIDYYVNAGSTGLVFISEI